MRLTIIGAALLVAACTSANGEGGQGGEARASGQRSFEVGPFQSVALEGSHDVIVTVGGAPSVRAEGDAEALERLDIRVEDGTLRIGTERGGWFSRRGGSVTVHVTAPSLAGASISGSGDLRVDRAQAERFHASVAGSGDMVIGALQAQRAEFSIAGSGNIRAAGTADEAEVDIAGSGNAQLEGLQTRLAQVSVAGSGNIGVGASEAVSGSLMGSGNLDVRGSARCSVSKAGSGNIRCGG